MEELKTTGLGEVGKAIGIPDVEYENSSAGVGIDESKYSPEFYSAEKRLKNEITHCKTCGNKCNELATIDGECTVCALKHLRKLETKLAEMNQIKQEHTYCVIDVHEVAYTNKLFPDWAGKFVVNGIELYPVFPLCKDCLDILSAYFVYLFESRGILRRGSGNIKNKFSIPYNVPLSKVERIENIQKLSEFINAATLYALDKENPMNTLYQELKERRKLLLSNEQKGIKEWQKEREVKLPTNQLETLRLAEKYYPCLQNDTDVLKQKCRQKEIDWLKRQPVPEPVIAKIAEIIVAGVAQLTKMVPALQLDQEEAELPKWNKQSLTGWLIKQKKVDSLDVQNMWKWIQEQTEMALGPLASSAVEALETASEKFTLSNLRRKLMDVEK